MDTVADLTRTSRNLEAVVTQNLFPVLDAETRPTISTKAAAYYLNRAPQTLRKWACYEDGPIRPIRINGRLAWRVTDLQSLLDGGVQ